MQSPKASVKIRLNLGLVVTFLRMAVLIELKSRET